jgi:hypothetical protein
MGAAAAFSGERKTRAIEKRKQAWIAACFRFSIARVFLPAPA